MTFIEEVNQVIASAELLYSSAELDAAISAMAIRINSTLAERNPLVLCVINGGIVTLGKLLPQLTMPLTIDSIYASRYNNTTSGDNIAWLYQPRTMLKDRCILIVDDILDAGITVKAINDYCYAQGASAVYTAVLLDKQLPVTKPIDADFVGFKVANRYLFGYGLDYKGYGRNAAGIFACSGL